MTGHKIKHLEGYKRKASFIPSGSYSKRKRAKRILKYIEVEKNPNLIKSVLRDSPDSVIKGICNIALNAANGDVHLTPNQKKVINRKRKVIRYLVDPKKSIKKKRALLNQRGNGLFLPLLISAVVASLGSAIFPQK